MDNFKIEKVKGFGRKTIKQKYAHTLPSYATWSILFRLFVSAVVAIIVLHLISSSTPALLRPEGPQFIDYVMIICGFMLLSEAQIVADLVLEHFFPVPERLRLRIMLQVVSNILIIILVYNSMLAIGPGYHEVAHSVFYMGTAMGMLFISLMSSALLLTRMTDKWISAQKRLEEMKNEKLKMDYNVLQDQLNPHFLFNNLSVLRSLIVYDSDAAEKFVEDFTDVYRYVLQSRNKRTVALRDEVEFMKAYVGLHQERLGQNLMVSMQLSDEGMEKAIAPLTAQLLVENVIKHNVASKDNPLHLMVSVKDDYLMVRNNLQLKETSYSTRTGLSNLIGRYGMLTDKQIEIKNDDRHFTVRVPLI